jgi:hypothetical protein
MATRSQDQYRDIGALGYVFITYSKSSPSGLDVPVRRACFPSTLSMVEYLRLLAQRSSIYSRRRFLHPHAKGEAVVYP